jgi:hypothetical protein
MSTDRQDPVAPLSAADADPELLELLAAGRSELPTEAQIGALAAKIAPLVGPPSSPPGGGGVSGASGAGAALKLVIALGVVGAVGLGVWWAWPPSDADSPREARPAVAATPGVNPVPVLERSLGDDRVAAPIVAPSVPVEPVVLEAEDVPSRARNRGSSDVSGASAGTSVGGGAMPPPAAPVPTEMELLNRAQASLRANPGAALEALELHVTLHPSGVLAQEREVLAIEALYRLRRGAEAERRASRFESRWPSSAQIRRVQVLRATYAQGNSPPKM